MRVLIGVLVAVLAAGCGYVDSGRAGEKSSAASAHGQLGRGFVVGSYNALGHNHTKPGGNRPGWRQAPVRTRMAMRMFRRHDIDIIGLQEFQPVQSSYLLEHGEGRWELYPGPDGRQPDNAIAWRAARFQLVSTRRFTIPYFGGSDRSMPAVLLEHRRSGRRLWVISVHNPADVHGKAQRWRNRAVRIERRFVASLRAEGVPVILAGDFNEREAPFCALTRGGLMTSPAGGSHKDECILPPDNPATIDWIFGSGVRFTGYQVDSSGKDIDSDHPLVLATFR